MEHHIIYISTASYLMIEDELTSLLEQSRAWNLDHGITGLLIYIKGLFVDPSSADLEAKLTGRFMQVLEGSKEELDYIFKNISSDKRHQDLILIENVPISQRDFESWQMGFHSYTLDEFKNSPGYFNLDDFGGKDGQKVLNNPALQFMKSFYLRSLSDNTPYTNH